MFSFNNNEKIPRKIYQHRVFLHNFFTYKLRVTSHGSVRHLKKTIQARSHIHNSSNFMFKNKKSIIDFPSVTYYLTFILQMNHLA